MRVRINIVKQSPLLKPSLREIAGWEPYLGITEEQEEFFRMTYINCLNSKSKVKPKRILLNNN